MYIVSNSLLYKQKQYVLVCHLAIVESSMKNVFYVVLYLEMLTKASPVLF